MIRSHGLDSMQVGMALAGTAGLGGALGTFLGGFFADRLGQRDMRWYLWVSAIPALLAIPFLLSGMFASSTAIMLALIFFSTMLGAFYLGPTIAISHALVKPSMRAMASAVLFFVLNLIGLGLGPLCVGMLSDALSESFGVDSLRYAIAIASFMGVLSAICFFMAARHLPNDLVLSDKFKNAEKNTDDSGALPATS